MITFHDFCVEELNIHSALAPWAVDHTWQYQQKRIDELQAKEKNNGWISVDERLPEDGERILTLTRKGSINICQRHKEEDDYSSWYLWTYSRLTGGYYLDEHVTHWQPLPPAPEQPK